MSYKVKLEVFEGPLDLLLYLIRKEELDIYDIPIAKIADQYLQYLEFMRLLDLNIAGEFIVMAATLMHIKSRMLLPPDETPPEEEEEIDPRQDLVRRLVEYKKFKEAAQQLEAMRQKEKDLFARGREAEPEAEGDDSPFFEASLFDLLAAFSKVLKEIPRDAFHKIIDDEFTVEEKMRELGQLVEFEPTVLFSKLFENAKNKIEIIATFLALLELIRLKRILVCQAGVFGEIQITKFEETPHPARA